MDPVQITYQTDPESNTKTMLREDKTMCINYPHGSTLTIHSDDTKIFTSDDQLKYTVEHNSKVTF